MRSTASALAAALLTFWGLWALADRTTVTPASQPLRTATERTQLQETRRWQQPDPRTLQRFPGP